MRRAIWSLPALIAVLVYFNALQGTFHFDDSHAVIDNPAIRSLWNLPHFFTDAGTFSVLPQNQGYRPLLLLSYALTAAFTGVTPKAFIAVNLLVHVLCVLLLQSLLRRVLRVMGRSEDERFILVATTLFAVHPIFSECINYVSSRSESLSAMFSLLAIHAYVRARDDDSRRTLSLAALMMMCSMLVKAVGIVIPGVVLLIELAAAERQPRVRVLRRVAWLLAPAVAGLVLVSSMTPPFAVQSASSFSRGTYFISSLPAILHYVALFLWPTGQSADAAYPVAGSFFDAPVVLAALVLACGIGFVVRAFQTRRNEGVALGIAWFLLCIFPSQSIFPLAEVVNEHRPYLGVAGLCPLLAAALLYGPAKLFALKGPREVTTTRVVTAVALSVLAILTIARNRVWQNEISLWQDVAAKAPTSTRAQMNYGRALMAAGRLAEAEQPLRDAVRFGPTYSYAYINLGVWLAARGQLAEATGMLDRAVAIEPNLIHSQFQRGILAERLNEPAATRVQYFKRATEISPNHVDAQYHLALALMAARKPEDALAPARKAVDLRGNFDDRFMLAYVLLSHGEATEAEPLLLGLQRERSDDNKVAYNLTYARKLLGRDAGP